MGTYKYKTTEASMGRLTPQHPHAVPGLSDNGNAITYEVTDVPDGVSMQACMMALDTTCLLPSDLHSVPYAMLRPGRIIRQHDVEEHAARVRLFGVNA